MLIRFCRDWRAARQRPKCRIYSSVMSPKRWEIDEMLAAAPHCRSKWIVNRLVVELGVPTTAVGPSFFADNWDSPFMSIVDGQVTKSAGA